MDGCVFCKIVKGELPSHKFWEDEDYIAILDIQPLKQGQALLIPKKHQDPRVYNMNEDEYTKFMLQVKKVATLMEKKLGAERIIIVFEGLDVAHLHAKLFPHMKNARGVTGLGERANDEELKQLCEKLKSR